MLKKQFFALTVVNLILLTPLHAISLSAEKSTNNLTAPTFCQKNSNIGGEELCFCVDGKCQMTAKNTSQSSLQEHYMLCVNSSCMVANDRWEDCIGSTCEVSDNAVADCIKDSTCKTTPAAKNASVICRPGNRCYLSNPTDKVYCTDKKNCDYSPKNHQNVQYTQAPIPFAYAQEYATYINSDSFAQWKNDQIKAYKANKIK